MYARFGTRSPAAASRKDWPSAQQYNHHGNLALSPTLSTSSSLSPFHIYSYYANSECSVDDRSSSPDTSLNFPTPNGVHHMPGPTFSTLASPSFADDSILSSSTSRKRMTQDSTCTATSCSECSLHRQSTLSSQSSSIFTEFEEGDVVDDSDSLYTLFEDDKDPQQRSAGHSAVHSPIDYAARRRDCDSIQILEAAQASLQQALTPLFVVEDAFDEARLSEQDITDSPCSPCSPYSTDGYLQNPLVKSLPAVALRLVTNIPTPTGAVIHTALDSPEFASPPSLDGSLCSEQLASFSSPPTPVGSYTGSYPTMQDAAAKQTQEVARPSSETFQGVELDSEALQTLLSLTSSFSPSTASYPYSGSSPATSLPTSPALSRKASQESVVHAPPAATSLDTQILMEAEYQPSYSSSSSSSSASPSRSATPPAAATAFEAASEGVVEDAAASMPEMVQTKPLPLLRTLHRARSMMDPVALTRLDIPSPSEFFAHLSPTVRHTWGHDSPMANPPTSTTAEEFYKLPWLNQARENQPTIDSVSIPVLLEEGTSLSIVPGQQEPEVADDVDFSGELIVGISQETLSQSGSSSACETQPLENESCLSAAIEQDITEGNAESHLPVELVLGVDKSELALTHVDRTTLWLTAQQTFAEHIESRRPSMSSDSGVSVASSSYIKPSEGFTSPRSRMAALASACEEDGPGADMSVTDSAVMMDGSRRKSALKDLVPITRAKSIKTTTGGVMTHKKSVRFQITPEELTSRITNRYSVVPANPRLSVVLRRETAHFRAFQQYLLHSFQADVFVHRASRFEALQAQRTSGLDTHRNRLLAKYQLNLVPPAGRKRLSANVARGDADIMDEPEQIRAEQQADAFQQIQAANWFVGAYKYLRGGNLFAPAVVEMLSQEKPFYGNGYGARILDLGGNAACGWAWHCAMQYPNATVTTVTTVGAQKMANSNLRGPANHSHMAVRKISKLPFPENHFDVISARELHLLLKTSGAAGEDEWRTCLRECMRVLKPDGILDFSIMDSDMINAGPRALAKSVEFGFTLKTLGYDAAPTKTFLGKLNRAGFTDVHRAWMCLPVGPSAAGSNDGASPKSVPSTMGSTDAVANVTGLVGSWTWERWLLHCEMEKISGNLRLSDTATPGEVFEQAGASLSDVAAILEEGRHHQSAWRCLEGYARKPKQMGLSEDMLDEEDLMLM